MRKTIELLRKFTTFIGITGGGVHTFYSMLLGIIFFFAGIGFESSHSVWAGFFAAVILPAMAGITFELAQVVFELGEASWDDILMDIYGSAIAAVLLTTLYLIFL